MTDVPCLSIPPETLEPLVRRVVEDTLRRLDEIRGTLPERLAFRESEAAQLMGLRVHQLRDTRLRGEIAAHVGPGRLVLYRREQLLDYLMSRPWRPQD
jgi:hypothetical protein